MRFLIVSLLCFPLLFAGCLLNESKEIQERKYTQAVNNRDSSGGDTRMEADLQTVELGENPRQVPQHMNHSDTKGLKNHGWNDEAFQSLAVFQSLIATDIEAARAEISKISKIRFGSHPLTDEWSKFFFRLSRDRKGNVLDIRRYLELEIQLLSDVDAKMFTEGIQEHQLALKQIDLLINMIRSQGDDPKTVKADFNFGFSSYMKGE